MHVRFLIVGAPRTGSTLLVRTLDGIDSVHCHGELLAINRVRGFHDGFDPAAATAAQRQDRLAALSARRAADPVAFIRQALAGPEPVRGFKALYGSLEHPPFRPVLDDLLGNPRLRFIHLWRDNALRRYVSECRMLAGGPGNSLTAAPVADDLRVYVDIDAFRRQAAAVEAQADRLRAALAGRDVLELTYEALARDPAGVIAGVCGFLGLDIAAEAIQPALTKVGTRDLSESVSNIEEVLAHPATRDYAVSE